MDSLPLIPFGPHATCTLELCPVEMSVLEYRPSLGANIAFICIFTALLFIHSAIGGIWRSWWFMSCMAVGCLTEILGYGGRVMLYYNPFSFAGFMLQIICVGCGPVFFTAAIYVTMAKIVQSLDPSLSRLKPNLYYVVFIISDVFALTLQGVGGGLSTSSSGQSQAAVDLSLVGLVFQVCSMTVFCGLLADYVIRYSKSGGQALANARLRHFLISLVAAMVLILVRCAYRVAELSEGYTGDVLHNEPLFIGLEGVLMVVAVLALCIGHPGYVFLSSENGLKMSDAASEENGIMLRNK
ncbi:RTA1-domain-containing protein [Hypoxylon crocopeplum]|nr:RTA1-domain-containing protein [Hypoxylon crocopeplum]